MQHKRILGGGGRSGLRVYQICRVRTSEWPSLSAGVQRRTYVLKPTRQTQRFIFAIVQNRTERDVILCW